MSEGPQRVRWRLLVWPLFVVVLIGAVVLVWVWGGEAAQRQERVVRTMITVALGATVVLAWTLVWAVALSRLRWRARLLVFATLAVVLVAVRFSLDVRGWTGDVVPVVEWRWSPAPGDLPADFVPAARGRGGTTVASEYDWPQFQGPLRNGTAAGVTLSRDWSVPPRVLWRRPIGAGWSGFAVAGQLAVTQEQRGADELVSCYDMLTGQPLWTHADPVRFEDMIGGPGPRATPAIHDGSVFALGGTGRLNAIDLVSGEPLWSVDVVSDNGSSVPTYGVAASPLVVDDRVVVFAGGSQGRSLVAYDARTGRRVWSAGDGAPAYGSPVSAVIGGVPQILVLTDGELVGHAREDGRVLWRHPWSSAPEKTFQPVVVPGDRVFVSQGYGVGAKLFRVAAGDDGAMRAEELWASMGLKAKFTNVVYREGTLYGLDDGILVALDVETGRRRWKRGRFGHGQVILAGDLLLISAENGDVALVEARAEGYVELGRVRGVEGKTWNHPALAGPYLLMRNDREAACLELPLG